MKQSLVLLLSLLSIIMLTGCGGSQTNDNPATETTEIATLEAKPTATSVPTPTQTPTTSLVKATPTADLELVVPNTPMPPTPSPVPPTPTPAVIYTVVNNLGFTLTLDGEIDVENSGLSSDKADINEGAIFFEYSGANSILMWFEDTEAEIDSVLSDTYTSFVQSQPDVTFSLEAEGDVTVDSKTGKYLSFSTTSSSGDNGGGIIGSWRCSPGKVFASTATGSDATVVQIRFKRLIDEFACNA